MAWLFCRPVAITGLARSGRALFGIMSGSELITPYAYHRQWHTLRLVLNGLWGKWGFAVFNEMGNILAPNAGS